MVHTQVLRYPVVPWNPGTVVSRYHDTQWCLQHPVVPWYPGTMVPKYEGHAVVPWNPGTVVSRYLQQSRYNGTQVLWYPGTMVPRYYGTLRWARDEPEAWKLVYLTDIFHEFVSYVYYILNAFWRFRRPCVSEEVTCFELGGLWSFHSPFMPFVQSFSLHVMIRSA